MSSLVEYSIDYLNYYNNLLLPINTGGNDLILSNGELTFESLFDYSGAAYADTYVAVILETNFTQPFISEKIVKSLLAEQMFVVVGGPGIVKKLHDLGVDVFYDIIDHTFYDNANGLERVDKIHTLLKKIQHYNWLDIYQQTEQRRQQNRQLLQQMKFKSLFLADVLGFIETFK